MGRKVAKKNSGRADLHLHTRHSDGIHTPREVLRLAAQAGLAAVAITDHDTVAGIAPARRAAATLGIELVPAVEVGVAYQGEDIHVLGYFIDPEDEALLRLLRGLRRNRRDRLREMVRRLRLLGFPLTVAEVAAQTHRGAPLGRPHVAAALAQAGWIESYNDAFRFYIGHDGPAYLPNQTPPPEDVARVLREAGGVPVLAHPAAYNSPSVLERFVAAGVRGLEVFHPRQNPKETAWLRASARRLGLLQTGGSDYHGGGRSDAPPGTCTVSADLLRRLRAARPRRRSGIRETMQPDSPGTSGPRAFAGSTTVRRPASPGRAARR